jgi:hypothetical protein
VRIPLQLLLHTVAGTLLLGTFANPSTTFAYDSSEAEAMLVHTTEPSSAAEAATLSIAGDAVGLDDTSEDVAAEGFQSDHSAEPLEDVEVLSAEQAG